MSIVRIGERTGGEGDAVDALVACHARIRSFLALAARVGEGGEPAAIGEAAARIERYFREAMPLHVDDEEQTILPRLRGREGAVDRALAEMQEQHTAHEAELAALTAAAAALATGPADPALAARLAAVGGSLGAALAVHLELEESIVFPAMRRLFSARELAEVAGEMRARRR